MAIRDIQAWNVTLLDINNNPLSAKGLCTEVELPALAREFDTDVRAGELGVLQRPKYFKEMEATLTLRSLSEAFYKALLENAVKPITISLSASAADTTTGATVPYVVSMRGYYNEFPLGSFSEDGYEGEITFAVNYISITFGTDSMILDPANYVYSINGVNQFASVKTELGL